MLNDTNTLTRVTAYDILGIAPDAPQREVHSALRKLALAWHPDRVPTWRRGEATLRFQAIMDAYNKLRTADARSAYDSALSAAGHKPKAALRRTVAPGNDNLPLVTRARAWLKAIETVFWPIRRSR
ncbi:MAG: J domain-containing protein [Rhodospirillales bacterium]|nr:J domain-containing protein [Alphaproteobacteria bacterium]MCB9987204.1 J domain-containing protein [Rhodospirillales bacterium]USO07934.1 MAG: J domain-containing protein [Rhodospirillales bacterium]